MTTHAGKVLVDEKAILRWLQYDGGRIHYIGKSEDCLAITIIIKHPDMPEVKEGEELLIVNPAYYWEDVYRTSPKMGLRTRLLRFWNRLISQSAHRNINNYLIKRSPVPRAMWQGKGE